ncbi:MAG TPA: cysteine dioxygenase family protein [Gemmataceae bacterium]|nr:cysteine dioxygenase family protein [Gemmataceae bacterium]
MAKNLNDLLQYLNRLRDRAPLKELMAELTGLDLSIDELAAHVRFAERTYRRNLIHAGQWYNLWALCWRNGQRSPIHDHRGSSCAVRVLEGTMTETLFEFAPNGHVKATFSRDVLPGGVVGSEDIDLHQVSNLQAGTADLVTLHIYSPPLVLMGTYSLMERGRGEEPMLLEFSDAAGI